MQMNQLKHQTSVQEGEINVKFIIIILFLAFKSQFSNFVNSRLEHKQNQQIRRFKPYKKINTL